jgi:hypothetical protein
MINGVFCHETGCPNSKKTWVEERQDWVRFFECRECGSDVEQGDTCNWCAEIEAERDDEYVDHEEPHPRGWGEKAMNPNG